MTPGARNQNDHQGSDEELEWSDPSQIGNRRDAKRAVDFDA